MTISALSLMKNATGGTTTGGTAMALSSDGQEVKNGVHVADMDETNFIVRTNLTLKTRNPQRQSDGSYSKAKRFATIVVPKELASGEVVFNLVRIETEIHPESTSAEQTNLHMLGAQIFTDSDLTAFLTNGSLA
jgi:hypothetical protein